MGYAASENNGGPPVVLHRTPVKKPPIQRGPAQIMHGWDHTTWPDGTVTYTDDSVAGFLITYHRLKVVEFWDLAMNVVVEPETVVTWEHVQ